MWNCRISVLYSLKEGWSRSHPFLSVVPLFSSVAMKHLNLFATLNQSSSLAKRLLCHLGNDGLCASAIISQGCCSLRSCRVQPIYVSRGQLHFTVYIQGFPPSSGVIRWMVSRTLKITLHCPSTVRIPAVLQYLACKECFMLHFKNEKWTKEHLDWFFCIHCHTY